MGVFQRGNAVAIVERFYVIDPVSEVATLADPASVVFTIEAPDDVSSDYTFGVDAEVVKNSTGIYVLTLPPPTPPGTHFWEAVGSGNGVDATDGGSFTILESGVLAPLSSDVAEFGPCTPWITGDDVSDCNGAESSDSFQYDDAAQMASVLLFELSARQYPGLCQRTIRPCRSGCGCWSMASGLGPWAWGYGGLYLGVWTNECGDQCGCGSLSSIRLSGYPVREILEVKIDGAVVPAAEYRLDDRRDLVRLADPGPPVVHRSWPACQDLALPDTAEGTFSIRYAWGMPPPLLGKQAAAQLAFELHKACNPGSGECRLPSKVTRVTRQGISIERIVPLASLLRQGATGLQAVDSFLAYSNPSGARRRPAVAQLDRPGFGRRVGE